MGRKGEGAWDVAVEGRKRIDGVDTTTFFITEFGEAWKVRDLLVELKDLGEIVEVVIPNKRNRRGRRYGFARFGNVVDEKLLAIKLDNVILEGRIMHANLPRFQRAAKVRHNNIGVNNIAVKGVGAQGVKHNSWVDSRSFVEVIANRRHVCYENGEHSSTKTLQMHAEEDGIIRYKRAFTGVLRDTNVESKIKKIFIQEGIFTIRVTMLGPNLCLLEDLIIGEVKIFIVEGRKWWEQWFKSISPWEPKDVDQERFVWISFLGIPCHAWGCSMFKLLAEGLGVFVNVDERTINRASMNEARILLKTNIHSLINESVNVMVDRVLFHLYVREETSSLSGQKSRKPNPEEEDTEEYSSPAEGCGDGTEEDLVGVASQEFLSSEPSLMATDVGNGGHRAAVAVERGKKDAVLVKDALGEGKANEIDISAAKEGFTVGNESATPLINVHLNYHALNACNNDARGHMEIYYGETVPKSKETNEEQSESYVVGTTSNCSRNDNSSGSLDQKDFSQGPISFDTECRKVTHSKSVFAANIMKKRKKKCMKDLGMGMRIQPSFYAAIDPRSNLSRC